MSADRTLTGKAVQRFQKDVSATALKSSNVIELSLRSKSPESAALGVNALVRHYLSERVRIHQREQAGFFSDQLRQLNEQLAQTEEAVEQFRRERQVVDVDRQRSLQSERLDDIRSRMDGLKVSAAQAERQIQVLEAQVTCRGELIGQAGRRRMNSPLHKKPYCPG